MQFFALLAFVIVGLAVNFGWDRTVRRRHAQLLAARRRKARPRALPPAPDEHELRRRLPDEEVRVFVSLTRASFAELDDLIDHFDLLALRARDRARFGVVTIHSEEPRAQAQAVLARWLAAWPQLDDETQERLRNVALGPDLIAGVIAREQERNSWEFRRDKAETIHDTLTDLDRAVIHMQGTVALLERAQDDPYR